MSDTFPESAYLLRDRGIEAEAVLDSAGEVAVLRFYADGRAFVSVRLTTCGNLVLQRRLARDASPI